MSQDSADLMQAPLSGSGNILQDVGNVLTRNPLPSQLLTQDPFPMWLYTALLGNSQTLVCLDATGSIAQIFFPTVDAGPHINTFLMGVQVSGEQETALGIRRLENKVFWLTSDDWQHSLQYIAGTAVVSAKSICSAIGIQIDRTIAVDVNSNTLITELSVTNLNEFPIECQIVNYADVSFDRRHSGNCCFFDDDTGSLHFFSGDRHIALKSDTLVKGISCEKTRFSQEKKLFSMTTQGQFSGRRYAIGQTSSAIRYHIGSLEEGEAKTHYFLLCCGLSLEDIATISWSSEDARTALYKTLDWWKNQYYDSTLCVQSKEIEALYKRSLIVLRLLTNWETGAIIAAPECDPDFNGSGGYGICWPRDCSYKALALDVAGQHSHARLVHEWMLRIQSSSGVWYQRYDVCGRLASTWGLIQFDEIGTVVWALCQHIRLTEDMVYGERVFSQLVYTCEYIQRSLDAETGLAPLTKDLWEEQDAISTYACASTWGAFHALSQLAFQLGKSRESERWALAASQLKVAIERFLWSPTYGYFLRAIKIRRYALGGQLGGKHGLQDHDATIDSSALALSLPFEVFPADDPRMLATADAIEKHLTSPVGGILRYQGDKYRGGNPWMICTLWLAWYYCSVGKSQQALDLYNWAVSHRTSLDLLPEQVDRQTGQPCWIVPLGWSHAMFLLVTNALCNYNLLQHGSIQDDRT